MKAMVHEILRLYVKLALNLFYGSIKVHGLENIPKGKAILIVANHQNALIDPLLIAAFTPLKPYFLTRASVFQNPWLAKLLDFIRMIPVYRVRDGLHTIGKNAESFDKAVKVLKTNGSVLIFGEGNHSHHRNLRPLKKGFARIAFQALECHPDLDLQILPVGINYGSHFWSGGKVGLYIGQAIQVKDYFLKYPALLQETKQQLAPMVTEIPDEDHQELTEQLINQGIDLTDPVAVKAFLTHPRSKYLAEAKNVKQGAWRNMLMKLFHFPILLLWKCLMPKIKDPVFTATFKFSLGLVLIPCWYIFLLFLVCCSDWSQFAVVWTGFGLVSLWLNKTPQK